MPTYFESIPDKPFVWTEKAVGYFGKKAALSVWSSFKRQLSTASEPLLRKNMGERYLSGDAIGGGAAIWILSTLVALAFKDTRSAGAVLDGLTSFHHLAFFSNNIVATILVGGALIFFHARFGLENTKIMSKYRAEGLPYHTQSRGVSRWEGGQALVPYGIVIVLLLFDLPAGVLFIISCGMSFKLASEQQAAIYSRYLDALDAKIEQEYLEQAILGKCPAEITQLCKPLPAALDEDLRKNIAAAAVGKPVQLVGQMATRTGAGVSNEAGTQPDQMPKPK
jgi:hypothetical protein